VSSARILGWSVAGVLLVGVFTAYLWNGAGHSAATGAAQLGMQQDASGPAGRPVFDHAIESGTTLGLAVEQLPSGRPLVLALELGVPSADLEPRPVRVIAPDGRLLHAGGPVDPDSRRSASLSIDPAWLTPGRYIVEVRTTERTHIPLRRYAIEVE
jgi:hypothetical protein